MPPLNEQPQETPVDVLIDATMDSNTKLDDIAQSGDLQAQGIMETNTELNELNRTADMILEQVADTKTVLDININGAKKVEIQGPKGDQGDKPVKGKDYFTKEEIADIVSRVQRSIKVPKDGETPVKGKDYFTDEEIQSIVNEVVSLIPIPKDGQDGTPGEDAVIDYDYILSEVTKKLPKVKNGKDGSPDTPEQVKAKLLKVGIKYTDLKDAPVFQPASKTVSLTELDDVDLSSATMVDGKYVIGSGSGGGAVDSVNGQTGVVVLDADDIDDTSTTHKFVTSTDITKLSNLSGTNSGDVTLAGTPTYLTIAGQVITRNLIDLTAHVTGLLPFANIANGTARSVLGRAGSSNGVMASITAGNDTVLSRSGSGNVAFNNATTTKTILGLENVDNTSDATKNSATATLTNKTITDATNNVTANGLRTATTTVSVSGATAPTAGQVLTATNSTTATWQTPAGGGGNKMRAYHSTTQSGVTSATKMAFNTESYDTGNNFASNTYTVPANGYYRINVRANFSQSTSTNNVTYTLELRVNNSVVAISYTQISGSNRENAIVINELLNLTAADTVDVYYFAANAGFTVLGGSTETMLQISQE